MTYEREKEVRHKGQGKTEEGEYGLDRKEEEVQK